MGRDANTPSMWDHVAPRHSGNARPTAPLPELQPQWLEPVNSSLTAGGQARRSRAFYSGLLVAVTMLLGVALGGAGVAAMLLAAGNNSAAAASAPVLTASNQTALAAQVQPRTFSNNLTRFSPATQAITATTTPEASEPDESGPEVHPGATITATITQQQAEQAALAAAPGSTVGHTSLQDQNGTPVYDVDFTNGGGVLVNGNTGAVISVEAAGTDAGGHGGGRSGGQNQAALAAQATVTQAQAEAAALAASPGNMVDHSSLAEENGTVYWDVDFANGGGAKVDAKTAAVIATEVAGTDQGGLGKGGHRGKH